MSEPSATFDAPDKLSDYLITVHFKGTNNSMPVEGFKTLTLAGPGFKSAADMGEVANVVTTTLFEELHYKDMEVTIINIIKLPV